MLKKGFIAVVFLLFVVALTSAQELRLGPQVGYHKAKDADDGKFMFGAALRLKLTSSLGVEGSIGYRQEEYADGAATVRSWPIMVTGLYYPLPIVYGAIGAGWYNTTIDYDDSVVGLENETTQEFGWHFGAGAEIPIGSNAKITGDIRYVFINYDFDQIPGEGDLDANFYVISAGLLFGL